MESKKFVVIGYGSVSQCLLPLLLKHICKPNQITIIDFFDYSDKLKPHMNEGLQFLNIRINPENYAQILSSLLRSGDFLIDLSTFLDTQTIVKWCIANHVLTINTALNGWDDSLNFSSNVIDTLYIQHHQMDQLIKTYQGKKLPTIVLEHGANPGLVSHLVKKALIDMSHYLHEQGKVSSNVFDLIKDNAYPELAKELEVKVIHISEKDSQISKFPKQPNEFTNTWSVEGLYSESISYAELGWGTHEQTLPHFACRYDIGKQNCIYLKKSGKNVKVKSWVPNESFIGMVITHGEVISINDYLTIRNSEGESIYCPTVHYAYCPCDTTILSLQELEHRSLILQSDIRIINEEIIAGQDKLGVLIMGNPHISWWTGSLLDINSANQMVQNQSATTLQVAGSLIAAIHWMLHHPEEGIHYPDTLPWESILKFAEPYWGGYYSTPTTWHPNQLKISPFEQPKDNGWCFNNFLVND